ncbi:MAG: hypothetical protein AAF460_05705 [Pseudomonadota bacterium]
MPAWRILVCVCLALGISMAADAAPKAFASAAAVSTAAASTAAASTGSATIRITVSHVPTLTATAPAAADAAAADGACVLASRHAAPHHVYQSDAFAAANPTTAPVATVFGGGAFCPDLDTPLDALLVRIVPE